MIFVYALLALVITFVFGTCFNTYIKKDEIWSKYSRRRSTKPYEEDYGTPTMGGLTFLLSIVITSLVAIIFVDQANPIILLLFVTITVLG